MARGRAFAVHGTAELAFTGSAAALLLGVSISLGAVAGAVLAALAFGLLGLRQRERDSVIGVVLAFGQGLGVLFLSLYDGRASNKFGLLTGSIVSVDSTNLVVLTTTALMVLATLALCYRPLLFSSTDPDVAAARGVPVRLLTPLFAVLVGLTTALAVPVVGAILVLAVMVTPGAAASCCPLAPACRSRATSHHRVRMVPALPARRTHAQVTRRLTSGARGSAPVPAVGAARGRLRRRRRAHRRRRLGGRRSCPVRRRGGTPSRTTQTSGCVWASGGAGATRHGGCHRRSSGHTPVVDRRGMLDRRRRSISCRIAV